MTNPEPGWYQDPTAPGSHRWWDGVRWTEQVLAETAPGNGMSSVSDWFSEAVRLARSRAGHLFTIVVTIALPATIVAGFLAWFAIDGVVIANIGPNAEGVPEAIGFTGSGALLGLASILVSLIASALATGAMVHQIASNMAGDAAEKDLASRRYASGDDDVSRFEVGAEEVAVDSCPWSDSVRHVMRRSPRVVFALLGPILTVIVTLVVFVALVAAAPALGLAIVFVVPALVVIVVRFSLALSAATLAPTTVGSLRTSGGLTAGVFGPVLGRLLLLVVAGFTIQIFSAFFTAPITSAFGNGAIDPDATELVFRDIFGGNPALYLASRVIGSIIGGITTALSAAGLFIIYRERSGALDPSLEATHGRALRGPA